jgi:hypothetical protein
LYNLHKVKKEWFKIEPKGTKIPAARSAHTLTPYLQRYLILFGGMTRSPKLKTFEDAFLFDTQTEEWMTLPIVAEPPGPPESRLDHNMTLVPLLSRAADGVSDRAMKISASAESSEDKSCLLMYGGMSTNHVFNDVYELILDKVQK